MTSLSSQSSIVPSGPVGIPVENFSVMETRSKVARGSHIAIVNQSYEWSNLDGSPSVPEYREYVQLRKMSATILPMCPRSGKFLLIRQYRYPAHYNAQMNGSNQMHEDAWLYETIAGVIEPGDSPLDTAVREAQEEGNIIIDPTDVREIHKAMMTPGVTNEEMTFFLGIVDQVGPDGPSGLANEGERIKAKWMTQDEIRQLAAQGLIRDAKTLICLYAARVL
jgi:8-oxo-dGTP pyrophosphatase MutT (NUDIX family)